MDDNNNLPQGWNDADEDKFEDSPWGDNTSPDDGDSSETSEIITPVSNTPLNTKLIMGIACAVVAVTVAFFGGMFVLDMFGNNKESDDPPSNGTSIGGTAESGASISTSSGQTKKRIIESPGLTKSPVEIKLQGTFDSSFDLNRGWLRRIYG